MSLFFTSDTHFGHKKQADYRRFLNIERMDDFLVKTWNARVQPRDTVYHLGDVSFHNAADTVAILRRLNGSIKLVPGNHDTSKVLKTIQLAPDLRLEILPPLTDIKASEGLLDGTSEVTRLVLCHFPMLAWNRSHYGVPLLHGHSHGSCVYPKPDMRILDVGVDVHGLAPISLKKIKEIMAQRTTASFDHHRIQPIEALQ